MFTATSCPPALQAPARMLPVLLLLAGCATQLPSPPTPANRPDVVVVASVQAARAAVDTGQVRIRTMTAREVMHEWGTRIPSRRSLPLLADAPYQSIDQIVDSELCNGCASLPYHQHVLAASRRHGVPTGLIHAVIRKESAYKPGATSHRQARGLMQITPETGRFLGVRVGNLYDPGINIHAGTAYLKYLMRQHSTMDEVLAAYNAGSGNVRKYRGVPPFAETRRYVRDVKRDYATNAAPAANGEPVALR